MENSQVQGTPQTDEVVEALGDIYAGLKASFKDGKFDASDVANFLPLIQSVPKAIEKISDVAPELKDLNSAEGSALLAKAAVKFGLDSEPAKVRLIVEGCFKVAEGSLKILEGVRA